MKPIKVVVKPRHFRESDGYAELACPLQLAILQDSPKSKVIVGGYTVLINNHGFSISDNWCHSTLIDEMIAKAKAGKRIGAVPVFLTPIRRFLINGSNHR